MKNLNVKIYYLSAFFITLVLFSSALFVTDYINNKRTEELKAAEDKIAIDILSLETQFELLKESSCASFDRTVLRQELDALDTRLVFMEQQVGKDDPEVFRLKRYYSILQIKDYLLTKKMSDECKQNLIFILYFYRSQDCPNCQTQEYVLRAVRERYAQAEIYTFDYDLDLPAVQTLISLHNVPKDPPVYDINGTLYPFFERYEGMEAVLNELIATSTATTTKAKTKATGSQ